MVFLYAALVGTIYKVIADAVQAGIEAADTDGEDVADAPVGESDTSTGAVVADTSDDDPRPERSESA